MHLIRVDEFMRNDPRGIAGRVRWRELDGSRDGISTYGSLLSLIGPNPQLPFMFSS